MAWLPQLSFRPCGISPLRRFSPQHGFLACCSPVPDMGFAGFQGSPSLPTEDGSDEVHIPTSAHTLRRFIPRRQPFPIAGFCSLLIVHPETVATAR